VLSVLSAIAFFLSSAVLVPVAVHSWGKPTTILLLWGSWMLGAAISYWIGRHPGRRLAKWLAPARKVAKYEKKISANANFSLVLLFQLALPSEIPGYVLGTLRYPLGRYLGAAAIYPPARHRNSGSPPIDPRPAFPAQTDRSLTPLRIFFSQSKNLRRRLEFRTIEESID
jgi:membrane protein YqaA with SNARE-associated domain